MMAGAKVAMMTSALLKRGVSYFDTLTTELLPWMADHGVRFDQADAGQHDRNAVPQPAAFERTNYIEGAQLLRPGGEEEATGYSVRGTTPPQMLARGLPRAKRRYR